MRLLRTLLLLVLVAIVAVVAWNYLSGSQRTAGSATTSDRLDVEAARERGAELTRNASEKAREAASELDDAVSEGTLTAKIKSKMALDDHVKARAIDVDTSGSVVTLSGVVGSAEERERALRLAKETDGVTSVIDKLEIRN